MILKVLCSMTVTKSPCGIGVCHFFRCAEVEADQVSLSRRTSVFVKVSLFFVAFSIFIPSPKQ